MGSQTILKTKWELIVLLIVLYPENPDHCLSFYFGLCFAINIALEDNSLFLVWASDLHDHSAKVIK